MTDISWFVIGEPVAQPRPRVALRGKFPHAYVPKTHPVWAWKAAISAYSLRHRPSLPLEGPLRVDWTAYMPRPQSHFLRGVPRDSAPVFHTSRGDRDNLDKAILDTLTELRFWNDDSQVCDGRIIKRYGPVTLDSGREAIGVAIRIRNCEGVGVKR